MDILVYARRLTETLHAKHFSEIREWRVEDELGDVLLQIDNMTSALVLPPDAETIVRALCMERAAPACDCKQKGVVCQALRESLMHESNPMYHQALAVLALMEPKKKAAEATRGGCGA